MRAKWDKEEMKSGVRGLLFFSRDQVAAIRTAVQARTQTQGIRESAQLAAAN
jgi:hypothetical protein